MEPELRRGDEVLDGFRVTKVICNKDSYALYKVEGKRYALCVSGAVVDFWITGEWLPKEFVKDRFQPFQNGYCYFSDEGFKIFTALWGPYPEDTEEIEEFACGLKDFRQKYGENHLPNLAFIEKLGLMLPLPSDDDGQVTAGNLFGKWMTGGASVDVCDSHSKVKVFCDWLDEDDINRFVKMAGLDSELSKKTGKEQKQAKVEVKEKEMTYEGDFYLPGREKLSKFFNDRIVDFLRHQGEYQRMGIHTMPAVLLYGKPGSGKTYAVEQLAQYLKLPYYEIDQAPSVLVIDEIEAYVGQRTSNSQSFNIEEVDEFLRNIPRAIEAKVIVFGMTNHLEMIDSAILRKGRFDEIIEVGMPIRDEVFAVLEDKFGNLPLADDIDISKYAQKLAGHPMSDISYVIREAGRTAVRARESVITDEIVMQVINRMTTQNKQESTDHKTIGF